jgi:hypothetical protein
VNLTDSRNPNQSADHPPAADKVVAAIIGELICHVRRHSATQLALNASRSAVLSGGTRARHPRRLDGDWLSGFTKGSPTDITRHPQ